MMTEKTPSRNTPIEKAARQAQIEAKGLELFSALEKEGPSVFNKDWWYGRIMDWSMKNEQFKTQMFRFVDVLPYLDSSSEVSRHLKEYFAESSGDLPPIFNVGLGLGSLAPGIMAGSIRKNITQMAKMFITGESPEDALPVLKKARKKNLCFTADLLGEATLSEKEGQEYIDRYLQLMDQLSEAALKWDHRPQIDEDENGPIPKVNVSVKVTALSSLISEVAWDESLVELQEKLRPLLRKAIEKGIFLNFDMEQFSHKDLTLKLFKNLLLEAEFKDYPHFGVVVQAYLKSSLADTQALAEFSKKRGTPITIRLVKGAYWDYESIHASQMNWPNPVFEIKSETDENFESCAEVLLKNYPHIRLAIGSHNVRSTSACLVMAEEFGVPERAIEAQFLYGMAEPIKMALVRRGLRVREYATIGELIPGMAYLVRRLLENTSNESFLKSKFVDGTSSAELLADPAEKVKLAKAKSLATEASAEKTAVFKNIPLVDFTIEKNRQEFAKALYETKQSFGREIPIVIDGRPVKTGKLFHRENPSYPDQILGSFEMAQIAEADEAIRIAQSAQNSWRKTPVEERCRLLEKLADLMERDRFKLAALEVHEVGKPWTEADGDICEAIDFCRYYAKEMRRLGQPFRVGRVLGETSHYHYIPRGVAVVIAPWNFPFAILSGMVGAALVTGNPVIMKPAEQSTFMSFELMELVIEAGFPKDVLSFLPGLGEEVGAHLVDHPDTQLIAFTGSKAVGLQILNRTGQVHPGQTQIKKCIIEMGGKNAIIVDSDADFDEAVQGVLYSAFGFSGQKCSACSRVIVLKENYDWFCSRLIEAAKSLFVGPSEEPRSDLGPVVDKEAFDRIQRTISEAKEKFPVLFEGTVPEKGHFVPPTIFGPVDPDSSLAQEEIFGPVLAVISAENIDEALKIANNTPYALTGGLFSRSPAHIEKVKTEFEVGNLYINRGNTGALVDRHPFGGYKLSGLGSKTGGPDYLVQFLEPRVITENTTRRGFAPTEG